MSWRSCAAPDGGALTRHAQASQVARLISVLAMIVTLRTSGFKGWIDGEESCLGYEQVAQSDTRLLSKNPLLVGRSLIPSHE